MTVEERVKQSHTDKDVENELIREYIPFILSCSNKTLNRYITREDDEFSIAIFAFYTAMQNYNEEKGAFLTFARTVIKNRLTDYLRKEYKESRGIPFSAVSVAEDIEFDIEAPQMTDYDTRYEIEALSFELRKYEISFFDIAANSPKAKKTHDQCNRVIAYILQNPLILNMLKDKKHLPAKQLRESCGVKEKLLERHRCYIIAATLIMDGEYEIIREYFPQLKEAKLR